MYVVVPFLHPTFHVVENGHVVARFKARDEAEAHAARLNAAEKARREARRNLWSEDVEVAAAAEKAMLDTADILRAAWQARHDGVQAAADKRFLFRTN
jgi:hypothetical protein